MTLKKSLIWLLAAVMLFSVTGCRKSESDFSSGGEITAENITAQSDTINLLYSASDTFNPYTAETDLNRELCCLLFDPLVKLDNSFQPVYVLADSVTVKKKVCTVTLKSVKFTDGTAVTADDVVYSYKRALESENSYKHKLYEVKSVRAKDSKTVIFNLTRQDIYFERLLDFPIIKENSDKQTDDDGILLNPVGSGRFTEDRENSALVYNKNYFGGVGNIKKISLVNAPDPESVTHYVEIGATDIYYTDVTGGNIVRMSGKKTEISLNNMVYIGINDSYGQLKQKQLRYAISSALDRSAICQAAYHNNAEPATGFFNPSIEDVKAVQNLQSTANSEISIENLEQIGYNKLNSDSYRVNSSGNRIRLTLLVNRENESRLAAADLIASQLKTVGIEVTVVKKSYAQYVKALQTGNFQLYLGEIETLANMDLSELVIPGGRCAYGVSEPEEDEKNSGKDDDSKAEDENPREATVAEIIEGFYGGEKTITDVANALQTEMPVVPVCFRKGLLFYSDSIGNVGASSAGDIYYSILEYTVSN